MHITLDHIVLEVRDVESTAAFYERVLGLEPVRLADVPRGGGAVRLRAHQRRDGGGLFPP